MRIENGFRQDVAGQGGRLGGSEIESYERVQDTFPRLKEPLTKLGAQFSGGEQQMRSIGRALMTHPELIILDEATEGLAPLIVLAIWNVICAIRASGIATLIVDCDYRKVLVQSDRALVLQKGQVVPRATPTRWRTARRWRVIRGCEAAAIRPAAGGGVAGPAAGCSGKFIR